MNAEPRSDDIGVCANCQRPIRHGRAYMTRIPFVGSWGGFVHRYCPPTLVAQPDADEGGRDE